MEYSNQLTSVRGTFSWMNIELLNIFQKGTFYTDISVMTYINFL